MAENDQETVAQDTSAFTPEVVEQLVLGLASSGRRRRQESAHRVAELAKLDPELLAPYIDDLVDALYRPEAQTRWEVLDTLAELVDTHGDKVAAAFDGAEASLFDEGSSTVRLAAFLFLTRFAASSPARSDKAWPLLDEAVQCYHGDPEYRDMLTGMLGMAHGDLSDAARKGLIARVSFDAENGVGFIKTLSGQIVEAASDKAA